MRYEKTIEKRPCGILWNLLPISKKHDVTSLNSEHWSVLSTLKSIHWPSWTMNCHEHYLFKLPQNSVAGWFAPIPTYPYVSQQYTSHFSHLNQSSQAWLETITWKLETSQAKDVEISPQAAPENRGIGHIGTSTVGKNHWSPMNFRSPALRSVFSTRLPVMAKATCIPRWQLSRTTLRIWDLRHRRREKQWVKLSSWIRLIWLMPQEFMWHQINPLKKKDIKCIHMLTI